MKKFNLDLQKLSVESFETTTFKTKKGTVKGNTPTDTEITPIIPCPTQRPTCDASCWNTCRYTCDDATCGYTACNPCVSEHPC